MTFFTIMHDSDWRVGEAYAQSGSETNALYQLRVTERWRLTLDHMALLLPFGWAPATTAIAGAGFSVAMRHHHLPAYCAWSSWSC